MNFVARKTFTSLLALALFAVAANAAESIYVKRATLADTRAATAAAIEARFGEQGYTKSPWLSLGAFDNSRGDGLHRSFPPEDRLDPNMEYLGMGGQRIRWQPFDAPDGVSCNLIHYSQNRAVVCYVYRTIVAERDMPATIFVGSDPALHIWLNGKKILEEMTQHSLTPDDSQLAVQLNKGTNTLLMKIAYFGGGFGFQFHMSARSRAELAERQRLLDEMETRLQQDFPTGEAAYYQIETIPIPRDIVLEVGGMGFRSDGKLFVCTRRGEVWLGDLARNEWKLFASGLHEALGLLVQKDNQIYVAQRPELTRITDTDGDGVADLFETVVDQFGVSGNYHEFHFGHVRDRAGNLVCTLNCGWNRFAVSTVPLRGWAYRVAPDGTNFTTIALGFRSPSGLGTSPDGDVFITDSQGDWWGSSPLIHLKEGSFYGHPASLAWTRNYRGPPNPHDIAPAQLAMLKTQPAAWFVYGPLGQAPEEPVWDTTGGKFGPFAGQMFVGDQTKSSLFRIALEKVAGEFQGAIFPFRAGFMSGITRSVVAPDGTMIIGMTDRGWASIGGRSFGLQRVRWTGRVPFEIHTMKLTPTGFDLTFTKPVDPRSAAVAMNYSLSHFYYLYHFDYGSPKQEETPVPIQAVKISADGRTVSLTVPKFVIQKIYELHLSGVRAADGSELVHPDAYYTLNRLIPAQ
ncbi:MAG: hypothetical protein HY301_03865 [Verrucomicrobia bacterium]|nr:hypothetical protein [Verrucomicrobiota bacterium]